jgi:hypothetical protein
VSMILVRKAPLVKPVEAVSVSNRFWTTPSGDFRPLFMSAFRLPSMGRGEVGSYLDMVRQLGFNGVRVLAGALTWAGQTPQAAISGLPVVVEEAAKRGLYVQVTILTDTATGYDPASHVDAIESITPHAGTLIEIANEPYHGTQAPAVHSWTNLAQWGSYYCDSRPWAEGAPEVDEPPLPFDPAGEWISLHLDRGRDPWNMVRRVRELEAVSAIYHKPVMNNEPIGWGEFEQPGRRSANPAIAFCMGALSRGFEVGLVSHAEHGLMATFPGPIQTSCHSELVRGWKTLDSRGRLAFKNATWADSPVAGADFSKVIRAYSFVTSNAGWTVLVGVSGNPDLKWQNGWVPVGVVAGNGPCSVIEIRR